MNLYHRQTAQGIQNIKWQKLSKQPNPIFYISCYNNSLLRTVIHVLSDIAFYQGKTESASERLTDINVFILVP